MRRFYRLIRLPAAKRNLYWAAWSTQWWMRIRLAVGKPPAMRKLLVSRPVPRRGGNEDLTPDEIGRAIARTGAFVHGNTCLVRALSERTLLTRLGYEGRLAIGVRRQAERLEAHAWVEGPESVPDEADSYVHILR